ncbi:hypothetical protein [Acinetobacter silvestris]|nr:hypothetical protein [Acinetobacter silvestris]
MLILIISGTTTLLFSNFSPTKTIEIYTLSISVVLYIGILLYFIHLNQKQQWFIPHHWKNFRKRPKLYCLLILPAIFIFIFWMNLSHIIPMTYTAMFGENQVVVQQANVTKSSFKGDTHYFFRTSYRYLPIFNIKPKEFQQYQNQQITLHLTIIQSSMGTIVKSIDHVQLNSKTTNKT